MIASNSSPADLRGDAGEAAEQDARDRGGESGEHERERSARGPPARRTAAAARFVVAHGDQLPAEVDAHQDRWRRRRDEQDQDGPRELLEDREALDPECADLAEVVGSAPRRAAGPQEHGALRISSMPSVVMNDGTAAARGDEAVDQPDRDADGEQQAITGHDLDGSPSISRAATTTITVTSEPTERSNSPETITKYWPAARIIERRGALEERQEARRLHEVRVLDRDQHDQDREQRRRSAPRHQRLAEAPPRLVSAPPVSGLRCSCPALLSGAGRRRRRRR